MESEVRQLNENLQEQEKIIRFMRDLSHKQRECLQERVEDWQDVESIVSQRGRLLEKLDLTRQEGSRIQQEFVNRFGLEDFVLSELVGLIGQEAHSLLKDSYGRVGALLAEVVAVDEEITVLMQDVLRLSKGVKPSANPDAALQAYRQAAQMKKGEK
ncbi:MAG: hypothetical protein GX825_01705 [Syntrophomonadaceae bacterium]|nr:hypothetical protein [Syntrophomonadaceae bacterium]